MIDRAGDVVFALDDDQIGTNVAESVDFRAGMEGLHVGDINNELALRVTIPVVGGGQAYRCAFTLWRTPTF
ncbi:MAG: hypothetical protein R3C68_10415 [Myxococcota bacterium]